MTGQCLRCEKIKPMSELVVAEGCTLCPDCLDYINEVYPAAMEEEWNCAKPQPKCKGCE